MPAEEIDGNLAGAPPSVEIKTPFLLQFSEFRSLVFIYVERGISSLLLFRFSSPFCLCISLPGFGLALASLGQAKAFCADGWKGSFLGVKPPGAASAFGSEHHRQSLAFKALVQIGKHVAYLVLGRCGSRDYEGTHHRTEPRKVQGLSAQDYCVFRPLITLE